MKCVLLCIPWGVNCDHQDNTSWAWIAVECDTCFPPSAYSTDVQVANHWKLWWKIFGSLKTKFFKKTNVALLIEPQMALSMRDVYTLAVQNLSLYLIVGFG